ncbi:MAG: CPBP family intramembrane metalloprotease [Chloroflexi bacterium]|nr:CPBP family intramembrane metalloprotease [Chloroflexota bacterium]
MKRTVKRPLWLQILLIILIPIIGMGLGVATAVLLNIDQDATGNLVTNLFFLAACLSLLPIFKFSRKDVGLKIIPEQMRWHVISSLIILALYMLFYIFVIRITTLKPFTSDSMWGILTYSVVIFAEELYFRGMVYGFIQKHFSARTALIVSALLFGLFHARQGITGIATKTITGWLWGSVRYSSGMIFLLIFPVHFAFNAVWLLFEGNWSNPPTWGIYGLSAIEILLGLAIAIIHNKQVGANQVV